MPAHFPESVIGEKTLAWCRVCNRMTDHRIDRVAVDARAGKIGPCLEHTGKTAKPAGPGKPAGKNPEVRKCSIEDPIAQVCYLAKDPNGITVEARARFACAEKALAFAKKKPAGTATVWHRQPGGSTYVRIL